MTYSEALAYISSLEPRGWRLGLDRMTEFVRRAGLADAVGGHERRFIHVAGTNGKGSVTAYLQSLLVSGGARTGAFFSPYVVDPRERVQIGREPIGKRVLAQLTAELRGIADGMEGSTFAGVTEFEFKTALGFLAWQREGVDWVALETGLGGRLDATNVVTPAASVIVSIGLDHQAVLGNSIEAIAYEKAGIIKPGVPLILGSMPNTAAAVIQEVAAARNAQVWRAGAEITWTDGRVGTPVGEFEGLTPGLVGLWQPHNLALAVGALAAAGFPLSVRAAREGAASAYAPGRYEKVEWRGRTLILDGAHNVDSADALAKTLAGDLGANARVVLVTNMLQGHEPADFYRLLAPLTASAVVPPLDFHRRREPSDTTAILTGVGVPATAVGSVAEALDLAVEAGLPILVTGSFYLVGEVVRALRH